jgi:hypothetical protein
MTSSSRPPRFATICREHRIWVGLCVLTPPSPNGTPRTADVKTGHHRAHQARRARLLLRIASSSMAQSSVAHTGATMPLRYENGLIESKRARGAWPTDLKWSETTSRDRSLVSYGLSHLKALELRMLQIERSGRIIACTRMRSAKLRRFGPSLESGFTLPHRM